MKMTKRQLRQIIREEYAVIDYETTDEVEAVEDAWAGGENLSLDIDHPKSVGSEETTVAPEILSVTEGELRDVIRTALYNETARFPGGPEEDIKDALGMLAEAPDPDGIIYYVIGRLKEALRKLGIKEL